MTYEVTVRHVEPRPLAAVRERMVLREVPRRFREFLDHVYAAAKTGAIALDGQNVFVYYGGPEIADVEFGVGVASRFASIGRVEYSEVPGGEIATATHWGDYGALGGAHDAVVSWCRAEGHALSGTSWEVYGHWNPDPAKCRTDVCYLLRR
jgi:effector-binding domain-containing protein